MAVYIDGMIAARSRDDAIRIEAVFKSLPFVRSFDEPSIYEDERHNWWVSIMPKGIGLGVPYDSEKDRAEFRPRAAEILAECYETLRSRSDYLLALFECEVCDSLLSIHDKEEYRVVGTILFPTDRMDTEGLVLSAELYQTMPNQEAFQPFAPGYYWIPRADGWKTFC